MTTLGQNTFHYPFCIGSSKMALKELTIQNGDESNEIFDPYMGINFSFVFQNDETIQQATDLVNQAFSNSEYSFTFAQFHTSQEIYAALQNHVALICEVTSRSPKGTYETIILKLNQDTRIEVFASNSEHIYTLQSSEDLELQTGVLHCLLLSKKN